MTFTWTPHRFSGGVLALDVANTIILRMDPQQRRDRFDDPDKLEAFVPAVRELCAERDLAVQVATLHAQNGTRFRQLREAIDAYFRKRTLAQDTKDDLASLLEAIADNLRHGGGPAALETATALSALRLIGEPGPERMKICANCGWLFLDRSKNRSRMWCDMAVCGNRVKASRHYHRKREETDP
ncbi:hypothetical protein HGO38_10765 [Rhizobium sp. CG5]|uniref:CGNR zinc finger domain-containing protein n=1 Tax=Rhizobium sp. CG5 TaxID=2726076 RepID=UPI0020333B92|nr:CGNR zinc finger domain-containing protein [Rhizobium sp. CG5]MCM2473954.1 hypothetical protein [Rhizobium sp. CG5]